ncbi:MAG: hypothetical protein AAGG48_31210 [Planctomycetota bacterium]
MTNANPYEPSEYPADNGLSFPGRAAVLSVHIALLVVIVFGGMAVSSFVSAEPGSGVLETELNGLDDFFRSFKNYSFVPAVLVVLFDLPVYFVIRFVKGRPTRWVWLKWTTVLIPVAIVVYYFVIWPMIRIPIEV